jgi:hypothetical protein
MNEKSHVCLVLEERYRNALRWKNLWTMLLFLIGVALTITIIFLILALQETTLIENADKGLTIIVEGAALAWVVTQRNKSSDEEKEVLETYIEHCGSTASLLEIKSKV